MDATKPYEFIWFGPMDATRPYEFIGFGPMDATKPYEFIGFGPMSAAVWAKVIPGAISIGRNDGALMPVVLGEVRLTAPTEYRSPPN